VLRKGERRPEDEPVSPKHVVLNPIVSHKEIVCCVKTVNNDASLFDMAIL
jgi:hypothetical protein